MYRNNADPKTLLTEAVLNEIKKNYKGSEITTKSDSIEIAEVSEEDRAKIKLDLKFYLMNPELPLENLCCRLDNYMPENDSQKELLEYARQLLSLEKTATAGLFIHGKPGTGKTHIAVALTKEFMRRGLEAYFLTAEKYRLPVELGPAQAWILDDLNSPYGFYMDAFKQIVLNAHNKGGRVFVTSNQPYDELMASAFVLDPGDKGRYMDRTGQMFKLLEVFGSSHRDKTAWYKH